MRLWIPAPDSEALDVITLKQKQASHPILCNLVLDEMSIKKQVERTGTKFTGYVIDLDTDIESDTLPQAQKVLVLILMLVTINLFWTISVGYFLINGVSCINGITLGLISDFYHCGHSLTYLTRFFANYFLYINNISLFIGCLITFLNKTAKKLFLLEYYDIKYGVTTYIQVEAWEITHIG